MGAAYIEKDDPSLYLLEDVYDDRNDLEVTLAFLKKVKPHKIIMVSEKDKNMLLAHESTGFDFIILPKAEYSLYYCSNRIRCLKLKTEPECANDSERNIYLNSIINFASYCMTYSLGLLLIYLDENENGPTSLESSPVCYGSIQFCHM